MQCVLYLTVAVLMIMQARLEVGTDGAVQAAYAEAPGHKMAVPLLLRPATKAEYFDVSSAPLIFAF